MPRGTRHWHTTKGGSTGAIPMGVILITSGATPVGWVDWMGAEDRLIRGTDADSTTTGGANGSWSVGTNGGNSNHTGNNSGYKNYYRTGGGSWCRTQTTSSRDSHTHGLTIGYTVSKNRRKFIKNNTDGALIPEGVDVFSDTSTLGPADVSSAANGGDGYALTIHNSSIGLAGGGKSIPSSTSKAGSSHTHYGQSDGANDSGGDSCLRPLTQGEGTTVVSGGGSHSHSVSGSFSYSMKRAILKAWTRAEEGGEIANRTIVMYEGAGAPEGWFICNGANGTIDLRGYFICLSDSSVGTVSGNNNISASLSIGNGGSHSHPLNGGVSNQRGSTYGHQQGVAHNHGSSLSNRVWEPPFREIKFIQKVEA